MKRTSWIVLIILTLLGLPSVPVAAQSASPTMHVTVGFDGYCHDSGWCPVYVVISNEGADIVGDLRIVTDSDGEMYARQVTLPAHSRKGYLMYIPADSSLTSVVVQLYAGEKKLGSRQGAVFWLDERSRLYGVASDDPSALNFLSDVAPLGGDAKVAHLNLEALPGDPLGWEGLDVLVLNDVDTTVLDSDQRQALETWVVHGGLLIVGGGAGAARTAAGVADLLPVTLGGTRTVDDLRLLGESADTRVATGPFAVAEATLRDGEVLIEQDGLILLARRACGDGYVDFVAFDAGLNPFVRWDDNSRVWGGIIGEQVVGPRGLPVRDVGDARDAISSIPGLRAPSTWQVLAFMLVYTLLIGPINYVVLRKLDRRELAWLTIPVLIASFTGCAYLTGFQIRGRWVIVHRLAGVYVPPGAEIGRVEQVVGVFSPQRARYDLLALGAEVREMPYYYSSAASPPLHLWEEADGVRVSDLRVNVGEVQSFLAEGYVDVPAVGADLRLIGSYAGALRIEGTVHNSSLPLQDAVFLVGTRTQELGDLEPGQDVPVSLVLSGGSPSYYDLLTDLAGRGASWDDPLLYRRRGFLQALFSGGSGRMGELSQVYLVGWLDDGPALPVQVVDRSSSTRSLTFCAYRLPMPQIEGGTDVTVGPDLIVRRVDNSAGYMYEQSVNGYHFDAGAEAEISFTVYPWVQVTRVDDLIIDMRAAGDESYPPTLALWNWESGAWDELDFNWGRHSIPAAENYVLSPGHVLLRVTANPDWSVDLSSLTITIKGQN